MKLSKRLMATVSMVEGREIVDVGTDHGYVPNFLCEHGYNVVATDISENSLKKSVELAKKRNNKIKHLVTDGLIGVERADSIIIAGMGAMTIISIIEASKELCKSAKLILQPMQASEELRRYLFKNGFEILQEDIVYETKRYFEIFSARYTAKNTKADWIDLIIPQQLRNGHPLYEDFLDRLIAERRYILNNIKDDSKIANERIKQIKSEILKLEELK